MTRRERRAAEAAGRLPASGVVPSQKGPLAPASSPGSRPSPMFAPPRLAPQTPVSREAPAPPKTAASASPPATSLPLAHPASDGRPTGPLLPSSEPGPPPIEEVDRLTVRERLGFVISILLPPIGLVLSIANAIASRGRRGWVPRFVRGSVAIGVVLSIVVAIGGAVLGVTRAEAVRHDELRVASTRLCATIAQHPEMIQPPIFGWPAPAASIPESIAAMQDFAARWSLLAAASPPEIRPGLTAVVAATTRIIQSVSVARTIDDAANQAAIGAAGSTSGLPAWHAEYCAAG